MADLPRQLTLADLARVVGGRWRITCAGMAVGLVAVLGYLLLAPERFHATAVVVVRAVVTDPFSYPGAGADRAVNMNVETGIALSGPVVAKVAAATGRSAADARAALTVETPVGGQLLRFTYAGRSAAESIAGANTAARGYLTTRHDSYARQRDALLHTYDDDIDAVSGKEADAQRTVVHSGADSPTGAAASGTLRSLDAELAQLTQQRAQVAAVDLTAGTVVTEAGRPVSSSRDHAALYLLAGVVGGALLGAVGAQLREASDRRIRCAADATTVTRLPLLGVVRDGVDADLRYLALTLLAALDDDAAARRVVVLSAGGDEGRTMLVAGLAVALATAGHEVRLSDAAGDLDVLRAHLLSAYPAVPDPEGHSRWSATLGPPVARDPADVESSTVDDRPDRSTQVIAVGAGNVRIGDVALRATGVTVLDTPPAEIDERGVRAARTGAVVLVAARGSTRQVELARLADRLRALGVGALGVVLAPGGRP